MGDILVRKVDADTLARLRKKAKAAGKSVSDIAREALRNAAKPSMEEAWAEADRFRANFGKILSDSTADIRADRDNNEPHR